MLIKNIMYSRHTLRLLWLWLRIERGVGYNIEGKRVSKRNAFVVSISHAR